MKWKLLILVIVLLVITSSVYLSRNNNVSPINSKNNSIEDNERLVALPQEAKTNVTIEQVVLTKPGFVVIRGSDGKRLGQIIEMSEYIELGKREKINVLLGDFYTYDPNDQLIAMIYNDNGDKLFSELDEPSSRNTAIFVKTGKPVPLDVLQQQVASGGMGMETVRYTNNGFQPKNITVPAGTMVEFLNQSDKEMWVASNIHPEHTILPTFDQFKGVGKGKSYMYTFDKKGSWKYHDHLSPSFEGVINVE